MRISGFITLVLLLSANLLYSQTPKFDYPDTPKGDVVQDYHGTEVADPYRWLEDAESEKVINWVEAQNEVTFNYLHSGPKYDQINDQLTELWNYPKYSAPSKKGAYYFFSKNDGLQNQSVIYYQESLDAEPKVLFNPNKWSETGTVALSGMSISEDGKLAAYAKSESGSDRQTYYIREVNTGKDYEEAIKWCKFTNVAWKHDNSGFYYNRFPKPGTVPKEDENNYNKVYYHKLGTPQSQDRLIYEDPNDKLLGFSPVITDDGKYLVLYVWKGTDPNNRIYYRKVESDGPFVKLLNKADASYSLVHNEGSVLYFKTNLDAPRSRLIAIDVQNPQPDHWKEIISQAENVLSFVKVVNQQFVTAYLKDAHHILKVYDMDGSLDRRIELPTLGTVAGLSGEPKDKEMFVTFTSFTFPSTIYYYDFETNEMEVFHESEIDFNAADYVTKQVFYKSKDGTRVPMFITHKKGMELNGNNPTMLYGYGGFDVSLTPYFSISRLIWLQNGGIYALANLRGGGEYGREWHKAGMLENKQNVFDDFIAAGEWLIDEKYTSQEKLAINGGSNGGLLVAACMLQRPELFGAVVSQVPVIDMLRYHKFTVGRYWIPEYGNAEQNPEHFNFLYKYSPLHNVEPETAYPPTLVTTADTDDRVAPLHGKKFVAALQNTYDGPNPILLRVETKAGHGAGKPTTKRIQEISDIYTFLFKTFDMDLQEK
ncbi:MAG: prolyl oligopeptidase family serine peptidase [Caldithrix sp.]|nr:prolyl oligopeptidase family serine peptidase [Caldithrix sp.]